MKLDAFHNVHTIDEMKNRLALVHSASVERNVPFESMLKVEGTDYNDLSYVSSSSKDGFIRSHYFYYTDKETGLHGFCELQSSKKELIELSKPIYNQLISIHPNLWLCLREDLNYDVNVNGRVILSGVQNYDVLDLGECVKFLQLDYCGKTSLICLDMWDNISGVYCMKSREDFDEWFKTVVAKRGYEGKLDNLYISQLFQIYFEVINTIFSVSNFKSLGGI